MTFMDNKEYIDLSDEFTFTFVDNSDIESKYQELETNQKDLESQLELADSVSKELYTEIIKFADKLMSNPGKDVIKWPNRIADLNKFKDKINQIYVKEIN